VTITPFSLNRELDKRLGARVSLCHPVRSSRKRRAVRWVDFPMNATSPLECKICGSPTVEAGTKWGKFEQREFHLRQCTRCHFGFVADPFTNYAQIYSDAYYRGEGADPLIDYAFELEHPERTIRQYEWRGIYRAVSSLTPLSSDTRWLDFGCGNGGLVRYCRSRQISAVGFEEGAIADKAIAAGIPLSPRGSLNDQSFDVITAIEVLEHVDQPLEVLKDIRRLLKPGGLFFFTTGNAALYRGRLPSWNYVIPEIHISFFEPETLQQALTRAGFRAESRGYLPGFTDIIRFKILKNFGIRTCSAWERVLPWPLLSRLADARYKVSAHPVAWAANSVK
jgi:SAM-dependent methyltransferase